MKREPGNGPPKLLIAEGAIRRRVAELAEEISHDYGGKGEMVLVAVLKGAFIFLADLSRQLTVPRRIEFMALSSYPSGTASKGVRLEMDLRDSVEGRHLLIVEDIVDTGRTLSYLIELLKTRAPASIRSCVLVRKKVQPASDVAVDYLGFDIPDIWVVGYGLDYAEQYRSLPYIGVVEPEMSS